MKAISVKLKAAVAFMVLCLTAAMFAVPAQAKDVSTARHSVVYIEIGLENDEGTFVGMFRGTGFFIGELDKDPEYLVTNHHVVEEYINGGRGERLPMVVDGDGHIHLEDDNLYKMNIDSSFIARTRIKVFFDANNFIQASVIDSDPVKDIAVLRLDEPTDKRVALPLEIPTDSISGKPVYAVGYPAISDNELYNPTNLKSESDSSITSGTVSRLTTVTGSGVKVVQTDTKISGGNSGGPLVNDACDVVGICSSTVWNTGLDAVTYAINAVELKGILDRNNIPYIIGPVPEPFPLWIIIAGAGLLLVIIAVIIIIIAVSNGNKKKLAAEQAAAAAAAAQQQQQQQMLQQQQQQHINMMNVGSQAALKPGDTGLRIEGLAGAMAGKRVMIKIGSSVIIGRNSSVCNVTVPDGTPGVSSKHCEIWLENGTLYIKDLGSSNGTFISPGIRVEPHVPTPLKEGSIFWLGSENQKFIISMKR